MSNPEICAICWKGETKDNELTGTCDNPECKHVFHENCLVAALVAATPAGNTSKCPMCSESKKGERSPYI